MQRACLELLHLLKIPAWRNNSGVCMLPGRGGRKRPVAFGHKGSSDILAVLHPAGRLLAVECKGPRTRQTPEQKVFQAMIEQAGGAYLLVRSVGELQQWLESEGFIERRNRT